MDAVNPRRSCYMILSGTNRAELREILLHIIIKINYEFGNEYYYSRESVYLVRQ
jgi:hypothetical protein